MLFRAGGEQFASGRSRFYDQPPGGGEPTAKIYVKIQPLALDELLFAQLDTAAAWSILNAEIADAMGLFQGNGESIALRTRLTPGGIQGRLERVELRLLADDGDSVEVNATVFVSREWPGGTFLGYEGLLSRVRFAIDPAENFFYFSLL